MTERWPNARNLAASAEHSATVKELTALLRALPKSELSRLSDRQIEAYLESAR